MITRPKQLVVTWRCLKEGEYFVVYDDEGYKVCRHQKKRDAVKIALIIAFHWKRSVQIVDAG